MSENENQTKVHFKMYKDGKRWVTRGLALFAVSLMVGGPVLGTVANVERVEASELHPGQATGSIYQIVRSNLSVLSSKYGYLANYTIIKDAVDNAKDAIENSYRGYYTKGLYDANEQLVDVIVAAQNGYDVVKQYTGYTQDAALTQALAKVTADLNGTNLDALVADNKTAVRLGLQADLKLAQDAINSGKFTQNMDQITKIVTAGNGTFSATQQMNPGDYDKVNDAELKLRDALAGLRQVAKNQLDQEIEVAKSNQDSSTADLTKAIDNANNVSKDNSSDALDMLGADAALQAEVSKVQQKSAHDADTTSDLGKTRAENEAAVENSMAASAAKSAVAESDAARSEAIAASQAAEHAIASENAAGQHNADSVAADASANASLVASVSASSAANSEAQSLINSGRSADASMEQSLAASAAKSAVAESDAARSEAIAASQAAEHAIASENAAGQHNADSVAADASANASLVASVSASSAANSEAQSLINSGRSADASMEQSLAASAAKSAVAESDAARSEAIAASQAAEHAIASENAAGQHNADSVAADASANASLVASASASSAANSEAQSLINSGRSADASMEQSLAASAAKSAVAESDA
ncbi:KxYKxGKxW signal peptide domain-containing protein, partial [Weissella confusa]